MLVVFVYGKGLTVTNGAGTQTITRPGFAVSVASQNTPPSGPTLAPTGATAGMLTQLDGKQGSTAGATTQPTNQSVPVQLGNDISANVSQNVQAAAQNLVGQSTGSQPTAANPTTIQQNAGVQNVAPQSNPVIVDANQNPTAPGTPIPTTNPPPQPVTISVAGVFKSTNGPATAAGFVDQTAQGRIPYAGGTITYPANTAGTLQNGSFAAPIGGQQTTVSPLTPGSTNAVTAQTNTGAATGTATMTPDGNFFYANLTPTAAANQRQFVFGGAPVSQAFYAPKSNPQFQSFQVQPDAGAGYVDAAANDTVPAEQLRRHDAERDGVADVCRDASQCSIRRLQPEQQPQCYPAEVAAGEPGGQWSGREPDLRFRRRQWKLYHVER